ncbi:MAG: hypothetical protein LBD23_05095 [Oscillospiraceae bacterium]|jgi:hypothetical protein|nr:hypothetical protein [Oscillospiraceae bacterium]
MSHLTKLKEMFDSFVSKDDVLLFFLSKIDNKEIDKNPDKIHQAVFSLQNNSDYTFNFARFKFSGIEPYSEDLDASLMRLETAGILEVFNPSYERYLINCKESKINRIESKLQNKGFDISDESIQTLSQEFALMMK